MQTRTEVGARMSDEDLKTLLAFRFNDEDKLRLRSEWPLIFHGVSFFAVLPGRKENRCFLREVVSVSQDLCLGAGPYLSMGLVPLEDGINGLRMQRDALWAWSKCVFASDINVNKRNFRLDIPDHDSIFAFLPQIIVAGVRWDKGVRDELFALLYEHTPLPKELICIVLDDYLTVEDETGQEKALLIRESGTRRRVHKKARLT